LVSNGRFYFRSEITKALALKNKQTYFLLIKVCLPKAFFSIIATFLPSFSNFLLCFPMSRASVQLLYLPSAILWLFALFQDQDKVTFCAACCLSLSFVDRELTWSWTTSQRRGQWTAKGMAKGNPWGFPMSAV